MGEYEPLNDRQPEANPTFANAGRKEEGEDASGKRTNQAEPCTPSPKYTRVD